jgi:hypothetical protein
MLGSQADSNGEGGAWEVYCGSSDGDPAYLVSGEAVKCTPLGSYGMWSHMVREPLMWLGEADLVKSMEEEYELQAASYLTQHDPTFREFRSRVALPPGLSASAATKFSKLKSIALNPSIFYKLWR